MLQERKRVRALKHSRAESGFGGRSAQKLKAGASPEALKMPRVACVFHRVLSVRFDGVVRRPPCLFRPPPAPSAPLFLSLLFLFVH